MIARRRRRRTPLPRHLLAAAGTATLLFDLPAQQTPLRDAAAIATDWLRRLDDAFGKRELNAYLDSFAPDHRGLHEVLQQRLADWLVDQPGRQRTSTLIGELQDRGSRLVAQVRHQIAGPLGGATAPFVEQVYLVFARRGDELVPTLEVELPAAYAPGAADQPFRCPPCNFEMGGLPEWLCVPVGDDRGRALETATFVLLGTDVTCELQIDVRPEPMPADKVIHDLTATATRLALPSTAGAVLPWQPRAMPTPPAGFSSCQRTLELPADQRADLHVACFGRLSHTLLVRGRADTMQAQTKALAALLATYRMVDVDCDRMQLGAFALAVHTGSKLTGVDFANERFGITCTGPTAWNAHLRAGGHAFQCIWSCPEKRGRLYLTGYAAPRDLPWQPAEADTVLINLCRNGQVEVTGDSGWQDRAGCDGKVRDLVLADKVPGDARRRWLRAIVFADLLVILDGCTAVGDEDPLRQARDSLRRR
ncbi:MAG: hypothetical protein IPK26_14730 [Planctomycetes bacterium]|nr:hypothetical protein [Planctomycetota bacterium]